MTKLDISSTYSSWVIKALLGFTFLIWVILFFGEFLAREINFTRRTGGLNEEFVVSIIIGVITVLLLIFCPSPKRVAVDSVNIYVSNLFKEIIIPKANIKKAEESKFSHPKYIKIQLKTQSEFGRSIIFFPKNGSFWKSSQKIIDLIEK